MKELVIQLGVSPVDRMLWGHFKALRYKQRGAEAKRLLVAAIALAGAGNGFQIPTVDPPEGHREHGSLRRTRRGRDRSPRRLATGSSQGSGSPLARALARFEEGDDEEQA